MIQFLISHKDELILGSVLIVEYLLGKTTLIKSNSLLEVVLNTFVKIAKK